MEVVSQDSELRFYGNGNTQPQRWQGPNDTIVFDAAGVKDQLLRVDQPCYVLTSASERTIGIATTGQISANGASTDVGVRAVATAPALPLQLLGDPAFLATHGVNYAYNKGCVVVVAAGNQSDNILDYGPPALRHVITVAATVATGERLWSSNYGANIGLTAPGRDIYSLHWQSARYR